ncbi:hypothetical protein L0Y59_04820, partial [Candidatus Uhrbacteria bacterium]|nr:hypothetical protein [Candidatus Uhrbacteria bacterium]
PGPVVGIALEPYDAPMEGRISVFVRSGWKGGDIVEEEGGALSISTVEAAFEATQFGRATIAAGSMEVSVSFPTVDAVPHVTVTPLGDASQGWWLANVNDHGFTIVLGGPSDNDLVFSWKAEPTTKQGVMWYSDGTYVPYDPTSGNPIVTEP